MEGTKIICFEESAEENSFQSEYFSVAIWKSFNEKEH